MNIEKAYALLKEGKVDEVKKEIEKGYKELGKMQRAYMEMHKHELDYPDSELVIALSSQLERLKQATTYVEKGTIKPDEVKGVITGDKKFVEGLKKQIYTSIGEGKYEHAKDYLDVLDFIKRTHSSKDAGIHSDEIELINDIIEDAKKGKVLPEDIGSYITNTLNKRRYLNAASSKISSKSEEDLRVAKYGNIGRVIDVAESYDPSLAEELRKLQEKLKETIKQTEEDKLKELRKEIEAKFSQETK